MKGMASLAQRSTFKGGCFFARGLRTAGFFSGASAGASLRSTVFLSEEGGRFMAFSAVLIRFDSF